MSDEHRVNLPIMIDIEQLAHILGCTDRHIRNLRTRGLIPARRCEMTMQFRQRRIRLTIDDGPVAPALEVR